MKYLLHPLFITLITSTILTAQTEIDFENPQYHSYLEKKAFNSSEQTLNHKISLLLSVNPDMEASDARLVEKLLNEYFALLEKKGVNRKNDKKKAELIFNLTYQTFLKEQVLSAEFHHLFENGSYNCVTSSALYALIFEHFDIPYKIQELAIHDYVIAYPNTEKITLEAINPINGVSFDRKEMYVNKLINIKTISKTALESKSIEVLYEEYIYKEEVTVDLRKLVSNLYYSEADKYFFLENYKEAYRFLKKGQLLHNNETAKYLEDVLLLRLATQADIEQLKSLKPLFILLENELIESDISGEIFNLNLSASEKYLIEGNQPEKYTAFINHLFKNIDALKHKDLIDDIQFIYHYQQGRSKYFESDFEQAMIYSDSAYQIRPTDSLLQFQIIDIIRYQYNSIMKGEIQENTVLNFFKNLEIYNEKYTFLQETFNIQWLRLLGLFHEYEGYMHHENIDMAIVQISKVKSMYKTIPNPNIEIKAIVAETYRMMYSHFLREVNDNKASYWLEQGLALIPKNKSLLYTKSSFEDYLKIKSQH